MKAIFVLSLLSVFGASVSAYDVCHACFKEVCYRRINILIGSFDINGQLAHDKQANILYFHFTDQLGGDHNAAIDLDKLEFVDIDKLSGLYTFGRAVDESTHDVYMSGQSGIYKYNPTTNKKHQYNVSNKTLWHLQYKDKLYYSEFEKKGLYTYENGESKPIPALANYEIDNFVVDKNNDIYFRHDFAIYRYKNGSADATLFNNEIFSLTTDKKGDAYLIHSESKSLYKVDYSKDTTELIEVGSFGIGLPFSVVFDNDNNIIYHDIGTDHLYLLIPNRENCVISHERVSSTRNKLRFSNTN